MIHPRRFTWEDEHRHPLRALTLVIIAAWFVFGLTLIPRFGLHYDEVLFVNAATNGFTGSSGAEDLFVARRVFGVPVLLMDYIGALKSWVFMPIFAAVHPSVWSIRIPALALGGYGIWVSSKAIKGPFAIYLQPLLAAILATSVTPTLLLTFDFGPVGIAFALQALLIVILVRTVQIPSEERLPLFLLGLSLGLVGIFNKLDFLIFALPCLLVLAIVSHKAVRRFSSRRPIFVSALFVGLLTAAILISSYMLIPARGAAGGTPLPNLNRLLTSASQLWDFSTGRGFSQFNSYRPDQGPWLLPLFAAALLPTAWSGLASIRRLLRGRHVPRSVDPLDAAGLLILVLIGTLIIFALTEGARRPWHAMAIWPLLPISSCLAIQSALISRRRSLADARPRQGVSFLLTVALVGSLVTMYSGAQSLVLYQVASSKEDISLFWSDAPEQVASRLANFAAAHTGEVVAYTTGWGIGTQIKVYLSQQDNVTLIDSWPWFSSDGLETISSKLEWTRANWIPPTKSPPQVVLLEILPGTSANLSEQPESARFKASEAAAKIRLWCGSSKQPRAVLSGVAIWDLPCLGRQPNPEVHDL